MAKKPTANTKPADAEIEDIMPEVDDDFAQADEAAPIQRAEAEDVEPEEKPERKRRDPRAEAIERAVQRRRELREIEINGAPADDEASDEIEAAEPVAEVTEENTDGEVPAEAEAPPEEFTLIVDGKRVTMSKDDVIAAAQKTLAGDDRLEEAKRLLKEAREAADRMKGPVNQPESDVEAHDVDPSRPAARSTNQSMPVVDKAKLASIVERIQVGDEGEGAQALEEYTEYLMANRPELDPDHVRKLVLNHLSETQSQEEITGALKQFSEKYPAIAENQDLSEVGMTVLKRELIADLKKVGVSDSDIAPIRGDVQALVEAHKTVRRGGHPVRSYSVLLDGVGQYVTKTFRIEPSVPTPATPASKQPAQGPSTTAASRQDRKRAMPQQPRTTGLREPAQQPPKPKTALEYVRETRAKRGFAKLG